MMDLWTMATTMMDDTSCSSIFLNYSEFASFYGFLLLTLRFDGLLLLWWCLTLSNPIAFCRIFLFFLQILFFQTFHILEMGKSYWVFAKLVFGWRILRFLFSVVHFRQRHIQLMVTKLGVGSVFKGSFGLWLFCTFYWSSHLFWCCGDFQLWNLLYDGILSQSQIWSSCFKSQMFCPTMINPKYLVRWERQYQLAFWGWDIGRRHDHQECSME